MEVDRLVQFGATLGVGGVLAAFIFMVYHRAMTKFIEEGKEDKKLLVDLVTNNTIVITKNTASTDNNTAALNELRRELTRGSDHYPRPRERD